MKKTLRAIEAKEEQILETVERPFQWVHDHWLTAVVVILVIVGAIGAWRYSIYSHQLEIDRSWQQLGDLDADQALAQNPQARVTRLKEILAGSLDESVRPFVQLELGLTLERSKDVAEARSAFQVVVDAVGTDSHLAGRVAKARIGLIDEDAKWVAEHGKVEAAPAVTGANPRVLVKSSKGEFEIELLEDATPNTTANFIQLVESGWYNGCVVHRVEPVASLGVVQFGRRFNVPAGVSIQEEGPGYRIRAEIRPDLHHDEGTVAMARTASMDSAGSQIFINTRDNRAAWDGKYTVFGKVTRGMDVVKALVKDGDMILKAEVLEKRDHPYEVEKLPVVQ
jgi:cyclophilin family peptidyl-prolyl cis-trans isomerase